MWSQVRLPVTLCTTGASGSLNVSSAKESDMGRYECVAENAVGSQFSAPIQLYVKGKAVRTQKIQNADSGATQPRNQG